MIRDEVEADLSEANLDGGYLFPAYDDYCFANVPGAVGGPRQAHLEPGTVEAVREHLADALDALVLAREEVDRDLLGDRPATDRCRRRVGTSWSSTGTAPPSTSTARDCST